MDVISDSPLARMVRTTPTDFSNYRVDPRIVNDLLNHLLDFRRAYDGDGLTSDDFASYGATVRTVRGFITSNWDLVKTVDDVLLPNKDTAKGGHV